jgi:RNA polymerase sigma factor (sigma-70 family)
MTDPEVVASLIDDRYADEGIRYLYKAHFDSLANYVVNNNGSWDDAQDIFQEVIVSFIHLVREGKFRGESTVKTFLYSMNRNTWLNELNKRKKTSAREVRFSTEKISKRESNNKLMRIVAELGEGCKKILLLFYFENRSMKEIMEETEYQNEQVVRNKKYKCLTRLKEMISNNKELYREFSNF